MHKPLYAPTHTEPNELCCDSQRLALEFHKTPFPTSRTSESGFMVWSNVQVTYGLYLLPIPSLLAQFRNESLQNHSLTNQLAVFPSMNNAPHKEFKGGPSHIVFLPFSSRRYKLPFTLGNMLEGSRNWTKNCQKDSGSLQDLFPTLWNLHILQKGLSQIPDNTVSSLR